MTKHKSSGAERQRVYMARVKENATRYAAAKAKDRQRWKRRQTEVTHVTKSDEAVRQQREMWRERKQRSRERKKVRVAEVQVVDINSPKDTHNIK